MVTVKEQTARKAWRSAVLKLWEIGIEVPENQELFKNCHAVVEIENIYEDLYDDLFAYTKEDIDNINHYLITGEGKENINHKWTEIYRERLFDIKVPNKDTNQIEELIKYLKWKKDGKRAQVSIWNSDIDFESNIAPCLQVIWFKIVSDKLDVHVHMRTVDCFGKLLMNFNEFIELQKYIAEELNVDTGKYIQFIDSLHFLRRDIEKIEQTIKMINL